MPWALRSRRWAAVDRIDLDAAYIRLRCRHLSQRSHSDVGVVVGTSLLGAALHYRCGNFDTKAALFFGLSGMVGAYFGGYLILRAGALGDFRRLDADCRRGDALSEKRHLGS